MTTVPEGSVVHPPQPGVPGVVRTIEVARGAGSGPTRLAAFDAALACAGVADFNLVRLSSVIPAATTVVPVGSRVAGVSGEWGDRVYVVLAEMRVDGPGQQAWAGLGWVQEPRSGKGLFVEHEGHSEEAVRRDLQRSLAWVAASRGLAFDSPRYEVQGVECGEAPACALVVAVYGSDRWTQPVVNLPWLPPFSSG